MSCRVLGRKVETMVLREINRHACAAGIHTLVGTYIPSEKNGLVRDHYQALGFAKIGKDGSGATRWTLPTTTDIPEGPFKVRRSPSLGRDESLFWSSTSSCAWKRA